MVENNLSKDEELEKAIRISSRPQPLFLESKYNDKESPALTLVSSRKAFFRGKVLVTYLPSLILHEATEAQLATFSIFNDLALTCDLLTLFKFKNSLHQSIDTDDFILTIPTSVKDILNEEDEWHPYLDAGAIYTQIRHPYTPLDLSEKIIEDIDTNNKRTARAYHDIEDIVKKFKAKYIGRDLSETITAKPLDVIIKDAVLMSVLMRTFTVKGVEKRLKLLNSLEENEIPRYKNLEELLAFLDKLFLNSKDVRGFFFPHEHFLLFYLIPAIYLVEGSLASIAKNAIYGLCAELYACATSEVNVIPIIFYVTNDLTKPFEGAIPIICDQPVCKGINLMEHFSNILKRQGIDRTKIKTVQHEANLWWKSGVAPSTSIPDRVLQVVAQIGAFEKMEKVRQKALERCNACPFKKITKIDGISPSLWGKAISKFIDKHECYMRNKFYTELKREWLVIYKHMKKWDREKGSKPEFFLPLYYNALAGFIRELRLLNKSNP